MARALGRATSGCQGTRSGLIRALFKGGIERVLGSRAVAPLTRGRLRGKTLILAYHGVIPRAQSATPAGERALHIAQDVFAAHLDALRELADVRSLANLDDAETDRPRVAITFDDAYAGAVSAGVDELVARGMPATIFVAPGRLDGHVFWWDALAHRTGSLDERLRDHALVALAGDEEKVRAWAAAQQMSANGDLPAYARAATTDELLHASTQRGITFGSHTWSHPNLARLDAATLERELGAPLAWLRSRLAARMVPVLAYPYGLESDLVRRAAESAGYASALRISGGWHRVADVSPFGRPRMNVPAGLSVNGLRARLIGAMRA
jgi:peptidoglycan/xylan/chitin deacetylase (PgdA/CDA1 family)